VYLDRVFRKVSHPFALFALAALITPALAFLASAGLAEDVLAMTGARTKLVWVHVVPGVGRGKSGKAVAERKPHAMVLRD
jgi:hypothetical protein